MDFQKLTPINDADIRAYHEALDYVFEHDDILNVAIAGPYSAGKSSIIETYKKKRLSQETSDKSDKKGQIRFLHISLAHFENSINDEKDDSVKENILEGKILNQLIQQVEPSRIPQSNFRVKRTHAFHKKGLFALGSVVFVLLIFYLIYFTKWVNYIDGLPDGWAKSLIALFSTNQVDRLLGLIAAAALAVIGLYTLVTVQLNKGLFKKFSVQGNEIEIFENDEESYFDKYLNEVLYLFERSDADVIVFEDIDRYNSIGIFQRLREINTLINRRQHKKIRFFYLLRDDMFTSKDRTKFFDFMIPVVPVMDGSNSYDLLIDMFEEDSKAERFKQDFLQGVSLYIDDMRILKNICNEYIVYKRRIGTTEQDRNKLLAMIIYKNVFPRDFSELQLNRGFVYKIFSYKAKYVEEEEERLEKSIQKYLDKLEAIDREILKDKTEIERLYEHSIYHLYRQSFNSLTPEYVEEKQNRLENIENRAPEQIAVLQNQIEALRKEKAALYDKKLAQIITRDNIDRIFTVEIRDKDGKLVPEFPDVTDNNCFDLLKYLIRNGFIDESYQDYMSYFYPNSLSVADKMFLRSITDQKAKDYQYQLTNPQLVVKRLRNIDFYSEEILNYDLLDHLLRSYKADHIYIANFMTRLKDSCALEFVFGYINRDRETERFIGALCKYWSGVFDAVTEAQEYSEKERHQLALLILYYAGERLSDVNEHRSLTEYIDHNAGFLSIDHPDVPQIIEAFETLEVEFEDIDFTSADTTLLDAIYQHRMYKLNEGMIGKILEHYYKIERSERYQHQNLSLIRSQADSPLYHYVSACIGEYMEQYLRFCDETVSDDEETVVWVLNHNKVSDEMKDEYTYCLSVKINSLKKVDDVHRKAILLSFDLAECTGANILDYFFSNEKKYDETLIKFINRNELPKNISEDVRKYESSEQSAIFNATVRCNDLKDSRYKTLVSEMHRYYSSFNVEGISDSKIRILIDLKVIRMNDQNVLKFMRQEYQDQVIYFIEKNIRQYCENTLDNQLFDLQEAVALLSAKIHINYKIKILRFTVDPISACNQGYPNKLVLHLLKHNFDRNDLPLLLADYDKYSTECQDVIRELFKSHINIVISEKYPVAYHLLMAAITMQLFNGERLFTLFSFSVEGYDLSQTVDCLTHLRNSEFLSLFEGKHPKFAMTAVNKRVLDVFLKRQWISSYIEENGEYRAYGKKR